MIMAGMPSGSGSASRGCRSNSNRNTRSINTPCTYMAPDDLIKASMNMHMCPLLGARHEAEPPNPPQWLLAPLSCVSNPVNAGPILSIHRIANRLRLFRGSTQPAFPKSRQTHRKIQVSGPKSHFYVAPRGGVAGVGGIMLGPQKQAKTL